MSASRHPQLTEPSRSTLLFDACQNVIEHVVDLSEQAEINADDREEVLAKIDGIADTLRETRARYEAALPQPL